MINNYQNIKKIELEFEEKKNKILGLINNLPVLKMFSDTFEDELIKKVLSQKIQKRETQL